MGDYIPDLTERYPEGFDGGDRLEPRDPEYDAWQKWIASEREYDERRKRSQLQCWRYSPFGYGYIA